MSYSVVTERVGLGVCLPAQNSPETTTVVTDGFGDFPQLLLQMNGSYLDCPTTASFRKLSNMSFSNHPATGNT